MRFGRIADQLAILVLWNGADDTAMDAPAKLVFKAWLDMNV